MNNDNKELNILIDRIVLEGFSFTSYQQHQLKQIVETELSSMFLNNGIPQGIGKQPVRIKTDAIQLSEQKPAPVQLGKQIAASIYNGLTSEKAIK
jgi:hypothetical protein